MEQDYDRLSILTVSGLDIYLSEKLAEKIQHKDCVPPFLPGKYINQFKSVRGSESFFFDVKYMNSRGIFSRIHSKI